VCPWEHVSEIQSNSERVMKAAQSWLVIYLTHAALQVYSMAQQAASLQESSPSKHPPITDSDGKETCTTAESCAVEECQVVPGEL